MGMTGTMPYPFMYGYLPTTMHYGTPTAPATPNRYREQHVVLSSPIDIASAANKNVAGFMDWMIEAASDERESEALIKAKEALLEDMVDLDIIKKMSGVEFSELGIPAGLGKRLAREVKRFMKK